jgi:chromosome segregation ATPase
MLKNWLTIGSIAFGVSFACVLPFNRDLTQSALIGLATIPGTFAGTSIRSRQRRQQLHRQITSEISRLHGLRKQSETLARQLQITATERQSIEARVRQLNTLAVDLTDRLDRDRHYHTQLEQQLALTTIYTQEQDGIVEKLDLQISDKRAALLELGGQLSEIKLHLSATELELSKKQSRLEYLETESIVKTNEIAASNRSLQVIHADIAVHQAELTNLEAQLHTHIDEFDDRELVNLRLQLNSLELAASEKQSILADLESQVLAKTTEIASSDRNLQITQAEIIERQAELANLESQLQVKIAEASKIDLDGLRIQLNSLESASIAKQTQLASLESQLSVKNTEFESRERDLQLAQAELITRQAELANLESQLQSKIEEASQIDIVALRLQLNSIELQSREKQERLESLESQSIAKINEIAAINSNLELTQLELIDRRSELAELEAKIYAKLEEMDDVEIDLQIAMQKIEPRPPQISRSIDGSIAQGEWHQQFIDNPHLEILQHIEKHGAIAEAEVNHKLGNPRSVRQFANKLEEYTQYLPFAIRVESSPQGNRYLRDSHN